MYSIWRFALARNKPSSATALPAYLPARVGEGSRGFLLSYLKNLPINKIKIDRSFVREVTRDHRDAAIIEGVVSMAGKLRLDVVVEGVETEAQFAYLSQQRCDTFQGFYFARPMPLDALMPFLEERHRACSL